MARNRPAKRRRHDGLYVRHVQSQSGERCPIRRDLQHRQTRDLFNADVLSPLDAADDGLQGLANLQQLAEIVAEYLDRDVGPNAGQKFVEPHLDGLCELVVVARHLGDRRLQLGNQGCAGLSGIGPVLPVLQKNEGVSNRWRHGIGRHLCRADLGHDALDLGKLHDAGFERRLHLDGLA